MANTDPDWIDDRTFAYHEAGHVVVKLLRGIPFERVGIDFAGGVGYPQPFLVSFSPITTPDRAIASLMGGIVAERLLHDSPHYRPGGETETDRESALKWAHEHLKLDEEKATAYVDTMRDEIYYLLSEPDNWRMVEAVAAELLKKHTIDDARARELTGITA